MTITSIHRVGAATTLPVLGGRVAGANEVSVSGSEAVVDHLERNSVPEDAAPTGRETVTQFKDALNNIPSFLESRAMGILDNEALMTLIIKNPRILDHAAEGDAQAIEAVKATMADGVNRFVFGVASYTGLLELGSRTLEDLAQVLETNPALSSALLVVLDAGVPMGSVLKDIRDNNVDEEILIRLADGQPRASDLVYFYGYLKEKAGGEILIDVHLNAFRTLLKEMKVDSRLNVDAISQVHITRDNQLKVHLKPDEALIKIAGIEVRPGESIVLDIDALGVGDDSTLELHAHTAFGKGWRACFKDWSIHPTGNSVFDRIGDLLVKIILSPILLILAAVGEFAQPEVLMKDRAGLMQVEPAIFGSGLSKTRPGNAF